MPMSNLVGKSENYFLETVAALGLKVGQSIQLNELMTLSECQRSRPFLTLAKDYSDFRIKAFFQKLVGNLKLKFMEKLIGEWKLK